MAGAKDGGWGWCVVSSSFLVHLVVGGLSYSVGIYYFFFLDKFKVTHFETAWAGSLLMAMTALAGIGSTVLVERIGYRMTVILGGGLAASGMALSVLCTHLWQIYLCVGMLAGMGCGLALTPSVLVLDSYFYEKRDLATNIAVSGMSVGLMVFPVAAYHLEKLIAWKGLALTFAGLCLNICFGGISMRNQDKPSNGHDIQWKRRRRAMMKIFEPTILKSRSFQALLWSNFLWCFGISIYFTYIPGYTVRSGSADMEDASVLVGIIGLSSLFSRSTFHLFSRSAKLDHASNLLCTVAIAAILTGLFPEFFKHRAGMIGFAIMLGMHFGYWITFVAATSEEQIGLEYLAYGRGFLSTSIGLGLAMGAPMAGLVLDKEDNYDIIFYLAGSCLVVASLIMMAASLGRCYLQPTEVWSDSESGSTISGFSRSSSGAGLQVEQAATEDPEGDTLMQTNNASTA